MLRKPIKKPKVIKKPRARRKGKPLVKRVLKKVKVVKTKLVNEFLGWFGFERFPYLPPDLNDSDFAWPVRRYRLPNGQLITIETACQMVNTLPKPIPANLQKPFTYKFQYTEGSIMPVGQ